MSMRGQMRSLSSYRRVRCTNTVTEIRHDMYAEHLLNSLHAERNHETCDVVIQTKEGTPIYAHSAILRQANLYFKKNLNQNIYENGKYQVDLSQFSFYTFQDIIDYLYTGQFNIVNKKFLSLVNTLKELEMDDIIDQCMDKLKSSLTAANVFDILEETRQDLGVLTNVAMDFIEDNFKTLCKSDRINKLKWESVKQILSSDRLNVESEDKVYQMALGWVQTDVVSRKLYVSELCQLIRIPYMTEFGLQNMICNKNVLTSNDDFFNDIETLLGNPAALQRLYYQRVNDKMGKIFVFGGYVNRSVIVNSMEVYSRSSGEWELSEDLNSSISCPRVYSASVTSLAKDNKIFIIGGQNEEGQRLDGILVFDGILSIWGSTKDMPTVRIRAAAAQLGRYLYVCGGQKDRHTLNEVIRYDIQRDSWVTSTPMNGPRHSHGMTSASGGLFVAGGDDGNGPIATAERYDKDTEQWTDLSPMSNARFGCTLTAIKEQLYVMGGWNGRRALHECEKYNAAKNNWGYISPMNSRRYGHMSTVFASRIYVFGGQQLMHEDALSSMESYCSITNTWVRCADMKRERAWSSSGSVL